MPGLGKRWKEGDESAAQRPREVGPPFSHLKEWLVGDFQEQSYQSSLGDSRVAVHDRIFPLDREEHGVFHAEIHRKTNNSDKNGSCIETLYFNARCEGYPLTGCKH